MLIRCDILLCMLIFGSIYCSTFFKCNYMAPHQILKDHRLGKYRFLTHCSILLSSKRSQKHCLTSAHFNPICFCLLVLLLACLFCVYLTYFSMNRGILNQNYRPNNGVVYTNMWLVLCSNISFQKFNQFIILRNLNSLQIHSLSTIVVF